MHREGCLRGQAAPFGATTDARGNASALDAFAAAYSRDKLHDTGTSRLWEGPFFALTDGTLDGWLLNKWYSSATSYDGLFIQNTSSADKVSCQTAEILPDSCSATDSTHARLSDGLLIPG